MRQRRVRGIEERLAPYADLILRAAAAPGSPCDHLGGEKEMPAGTQKEPSLLCSDNPRVSASEDILHARWYQRPSLRYELPGGYERVYAEFGCGRGLFINTMASEDPDGLYIGIEGCKTIIIRGLEKTKAAGLSNVRYIDAFVNDAVSALGCGTLGGLFLNFSDPWPKDRHADRRLTAPGKAEKYMSVLKDGGFVSFKTDGEAFFKYSLETFTNAGFHIAGAACDIAALAYEPGIAERGAAVQTEYEIKFRALGKPVYHFTGIKK